MFHRISYQNIFESSGKLRLFESTFGGDLIYPIAILIYMYIYNVFHNRQKEDIWAQVASLDGKIMKLEMQIGMLQSDLIQVN